MATISNSSYAHFFNQRVFGQKLGFGEWPALLTLLIGDPHRNKYFAQALATSLRGRRSGSLRGARSWTGTRRIIWKRCDTVFLARPHVEEFVVKKLLINFLTI
jgi:hypothetical protein